MNYSGEGHLTRAGADSRQRAHVTGQALSMLEPGLPFVSFSLYCPKDNIEEALLLLLISESMVSPGCALGPLALWTRAVGLGCVPAMPPKWELLGTTPAGGE